MDKNELSPTIQALADAIEKKGLKLTFGLQPSHIELIESTMKEDWMWHNEYYWSDIAKKIGWSTLTLVLWYQRYKSEQQSLWSAIEWYTKRNFEVLFFYGEPNRMKIEVLFLDMHVVSEFVNNTEDAIKWLNAIRNDETQHESVKQTFRDREKYYNEKKNPI
jgi:hypothetical protein